MSAAQARVKNMPKAIMPQNIIQEVPEGNSCCGSITNTELLDRMCMIW
jgi:hypothetical protein